jgi:hypothetical protein
MALTDKDILARLDEVWLGGTGDFTGTTRTEYHALRLVAGRAVEGDDWFVAIERILGSFIDDIEEEPFAAAVWTTACGPRTDDRLSKGKLELLREPRDLRLRASERNATSLSIEGILLTGPGGPLECHDSMIDEHDLRAGLVTNLNQTAESPVDVVLIRAYMAAFPGGLFYPVGHLGTLLGLTAQESYMTVGSTAFEHVIGRPHDDEEPFGWAPLDEVSIQPSESEAYRSLASALASRDPSLFRPGTPNLDWRHWARFEDLKAERTPPEPTPPT